MFSLLALSVLRKRHMIGRQQVFIFYIEATTAPACSFHRCSFTPYTTNQTMSAAAPRTANMEVRGNIRPPSGGYKKVSQPKPPTTDIAPRARGRKLDLIMR